MDRETADEIKRYVKILYEDIGQKIQLLAEGQQVVLQKVEGVEQGLKTLEKSASLRNRRDASAATRTRVVGGA